MNKLTRTKYYFITLLYSSIIIGQNQLDGYTANTNSNISHQAESNEAISVNTTNGKSTATVPIHNFKGRELDLPISISYLTDGIRVDEVASNVGLGWDLNIAGKISRIVNLVADDTSETYSYFPVIPSATIADFYMVNALGYSDYLKFNDDNMNPNLMSSVLKKCQVQITGGNTRGFDTLTLTADDGTTFYFGQNSAIATITTTGSVVTSYPNDNVSTTEWMLTKIVSKNKLDEFVFHYQQYEWLNPIYNYGEGRIVENSSGQFQHLTTSSYKITQQMISEVIYNGTKIIDFNYLPRADMVYVTGSTVGNALSEIRFYGFNDTGIYKKAKFNYAYFGDVSAQSYLNRRLKLDNVVLQGKDGSGFIDGDKYSFEYQNAENVPSVMSYAKDYLGLFNGKTANQNLLPSYSFNFVENEFTNSPPAQDKRGFDLEKSLTGVLKKIIYPSKGYTSISYEQNALMGGYGNRAIPEISHVVDDYDEKLHLVCGSNGSCVNNLPNSESDINTNMTGLNLGNFPEAPNTVRSCYKIQTSLLRVAAGSGNNFALETYGYGVYMIQKIGNCDLNQDEVVSCNGGTSGVNDFELTDNTCLINKNLIYYNGLTSSCSSADFIAGGWAEGDGSMINLMLPDGNYQITCWSFYGENDVDLKLYKIIPRTVIDHPFEIRNLDASTNFVDGFRVSGVANYDHSDQFISAKLYKYRAGYRTATINNYNYSNISESANGYTRTITSRGYIDSDFIKYLKTYVVDVDSNNVGNGYAEFVFSPIIETEQLIEQYINNGETLENTDLYFLNYPISYYTYSGYPISIDFNYHDRFKTFKKRIYNKQQQLLNEDHYVYGNTGEGLAFNNELNYSRSEDFLLSKNDINIPDPSHPNEKTETTTIFTYDSTLLTQISGNGITEDYYYDIESQLAANITNSNPYLYNSVTDITNSIKGTTKFIYSEFPGVFQGNAVKRYFVSEIQTKANYPTAQLFPAIKCTYDTYGNMVEKISFTPGSLTPASSESYLYGYGNRFVVAKLTGVAYNTISPARINTIRQLSGIAITPAGDNALRTELALLGTDHPDALITTYTYDPSYGMTSSTDPKGYTLFYEYDAFGRPKFTKEKDQAGNAMIVKENQYNTRP